MGISEWFKKWHLYVSASEFGHGKEDVVLGTLGTFLSDEIKAAVHFSERYSVNEILEDVRDYLDNSVCPLPLQHLEVVRFIQTPGMSPAEAAHCMCKMFMNNHMGLCTEDDWLFLLVLSLQQNKDVMTKIQEKIPK